jgi:putative DNA primase/helicase
MIAELADEEWEERAEKALIYYMKSIQEDSVPRERQLLSDTQAIIHKLGEDKIRTATLLSELVSFPDSEWGKLNFGNPITEKFIAKRLKTYGITPHNLRFGENTFKGYYRFEVEKACAIYLPNQSKSDTADTADTELNFVAPVAPVAPVAGKADLEEARWFEEQEII